MSFVIAPSILSANFAKLAEEVNAVLQAGADWIHFDVMDNHYVPNLTFGPLVCSALRKEGIKAPIDVHLMVQPVDSLVAMFAEAGASIISFHPEASLHVHRTITLIKSFGIQAGIAINPATPVSLIAPIIDEIDMILLMSVNPGFGGQKFIPSVLKKCVEAKKIITSSKKNIRLEIDGGVGISNIRSLADAGIDTFVAGSAIFGSADYAKAINKMREQLRG